MIQMPMSTTNYSVNFAISGGLIKGSVIRKGLGCGTRKKAFQHHLFWHRYLGIRKEQQVHK